MHIFFEPIIILSGNYPDEIRNTYKDIHEKSLHVYNSEKLQIYYIVNKRKLIKYIRTYALKLDYGDGCTTLQIY